MPRQLPSASEIDKQWRQMFDAERILLENRAATTFDRRKGDGKRDYLIGLCLSGGGIRSATVSLGVLQVLAGAGLLRHVDYISSVSGGGYTASGLAYHYALLPKRGADPDADFPFSPERLDPKRSDERDDPGETLVDDSKRQRLAYLRNHANYLSHTGLADLAKGFFVVARALLLNMFIWITLGGTLLAVLMLSSHWLAGGTDDNCVIYSVQCSGNQFFDALLTAAVVFGVLLFALAIGLSLSSWRLKTPASHAEAWMSQSFVALAALGGAVASLILARYALGPFDQWGAAVLQDAPPIWLLPVLTLLILVTLGFLALAIGPAWSARPGQTLSQKYARRYVQENICARALIAIAGLLLVGSLPVIRDLLARIPVLGDLAGAHGRGPLSTVVYLVALGSALYGSYRANLQGTLGLKSSFLIVAGSAFLVFGAMLLSYEVAVAQIGLFHKGAVLTLADMATLAAPIVAFCLCVFVNINDIGLGRYYRDRLMETFMPDQELVDRDEIGPAAAADRFRLTEIIARLQPRAAAEGTMIERCIERVRRPPEGRQAAAPTSLVGPYPIINANLMTHAFGDATARRRGGDNFVLTPLRCGSSTTGWRETGEVAGGRFALATAMATSGAAANPRGGFGGTGPTTNPAVIVAMSLLSIRLGYWLRWHDRAGLLGWLNPHGNHVRPGATDLVGGPGPFIELTDGGHFENLGLYELVRRRCGLIIVCDGGDDRTASYANFTVAARRIEEDFGVTFDFDFEIGNGTGFERSGPQHLVARTAADEYPKDAEYARRGYFLASVHYQSARPRVPMAGDGDGPQAGLVIYLKSAMIPKLSLTSRTYKGANADFPYESTADQFFSTEQFEAYRDVGVSITRQMLKETDFVQLFGEGERPSLAALRSTHGFAGPVDWKPWTEPNGKGGFGGNGTHTGNGVVAPDRSIG